MPFKRYITAPIVAMITKGASALLNNTRKKCGKVGYNSPAAARKALKGHGYRIGCKQFYKCPHHGTDVMYHLTSMKKED